MTPERDVKLWRRDVLRIVDILCDTPPHPAPECENWLTLLKDASAGAVRQDMAWSALPPDPVVSALEPEDADESDTEVYGEPVGSDAVIDWPETRPEPAAPAAG